MSDLRVNARLTIHQGKLERFKELAAECRRIVLEKDTATLQYDWFIDETGTQCVVQEHYASSEAVLQHIEHVGEPLKQLLEICEARIEVFGEPAEELIQATQQFDIKMFAPLQRAVITA